MGVIYSVLSFYQVLMLIKDRVAMKSFKTNMKSGQTFRRNLRHAEKIHFPDKTVFRKKFAQNNHNQMSLFSGLYDVANPQSWTKS